MKIYIITIVLLLALVTTVGVLTPIPATGGTSNTVGNSAITAGFSNDIYGYGTIIPDNDLGMSIDQNSLNLTPASSSNINP